MSAAAPEGRTCVGVVFGGPSAEHEVSAASALAVIRGLRATRFRPVAIAIARDGCWRLPQARALLTMRSAVSPAGSNGRGTLLYAAVRRWWFEADAWRDPGTQREFLARMNRYQAEGLPPSEQRITREDILPAESVT
jgi:D-alanine-D-alanine ligase-like ATP-grasp enzyme